ncbi:MAG: isochorismatase family protein [Patescibacteria group bacterium]
MNKIKLISVDFQKDFSSVDGKAYESRPCIDFIKQTLIPFLRENNIKVAEIISDYRAPRSGTTRVCLPGESGFESEIPEDVKFEDIWIKSMNSPLWTRDNRGIADKDPGIPYQDSEGFRVWLTNNIGSPDDEHDIVLFGLTLDCCVLSTAQELKWRGYNVFVLEEGVDSFSGDKKEKEWILNHVPLKNWAKVIKWEELKSRLLNDN